MEKTYLAIDLKSFYASCECKDRNLDPFTTPLVVADVSRGNGTIIMAVSPYLKTLNIPSRLRLYELPKIKGMIYAKPRMERYIKMSLEVIKVYLNHVAKEDLHIYSIDEAILDVTHYLNGEDKKVYAKKIIDEVYKKTGLTVTCGIGPNMLLAKVSMDIEAKHVKDNIACWNLDDIKTKLWNIKPLSKMWGIGHNLEKRLNNLGIYSIGELACSSKKMLKDIFGVIGEQLHEHANGIDDSDIRKPYISQNKSLSVGQTLFSDYNLEDTHLLLTEMLDELIIRLKEKNYLTSKIGLCVSYSNHSSGFGKCIPFSNPTNSYFELLNALEKILYTYFDTSKNARSIYLVASELTSDKYYQISLFDEEKKEEERKLFQTVYQLKKQFGKEKIIRASSLLSKSNALRRMKQIGGHAK